jgi:uncharacterized protein (DUF2237 family)
MAAEREDQQAARRKRGTPRLTADLRVAPVLLDARLAREAHAASPLDGAARDALCDLGRVDLGHRRLLRERATLLLQACGVVHKQARGLDLRGGVGHLELHALEAGHRLAELRAVVRVAHALLVRALRNADHLRANAHAALVENLNGNLVALALLANQVGRGHLDVVKVDRARRRGLDAELLLLLGNLDAHALLDGKGRNALVALRGVALREDNEELGLGRVGDPHLAAVDDPVAVRVLLARRLHGEGV